MTVTASRRLSCGSLRHHEAHEWIGQTSTEVYACPGANGPRGLPSQRDLDEMDPARCLADQIEVGGL